MMMTKKRRMVTLLPSEFVSPQDIELKSEEKHESLILFG